MKQRKLHNIFLSVLNIVNASCFIALLICARYNLIVPTIALSIVNASCFILAMINPLLAKFKTGLFEIITAVWSSVVFVLIAVAYIYYIPNEKLSEIILTLVSSTLGGFLTLLGVGLTIKHSRMVKKEDEIKALKPSVFIIDDSTWKTIPKDKKISTKIGINDDFTDFKRADKTKMRYELAPLLITNSDVSICDVYGLMVNEQLIKFEFERVLPKNTLNKLTIDYQFETAENIESVDIVLEDALHNVYLGCTNFEIEQKRNSNVKRIKIKSILDITIVDEYIGVARD